MRAIDRAADVVLRVCLSPRPRLEYINRAILALTGYSPEELYANRALAMRLVHASDRRKLLDIARSGRVPRRPLVLKCVRRDGTIAKVEVKATPVRGRSGALTAVEAIARDVPVARGKVPPAPRQDAAAKLVEQAPIGLAQLAADGRLLRVNPRLSELTGYAAAELVGLRLHDLTHPEDMPRDVALLRGITSNEISSYTIEKRCVCKGGACLWVRVMASFPRAASGSVLDGVAVVEPIPAPGARDAELGRLSYNGIEMDTDRLEVTWNGRTVALTLKEVLLFRYLIRHRGEMLPRDRLLRDVWGYKYSGRSRTLDVHVCRLRRKLPPLATSLVTIGHFGYTLSQDALVGVAAPAGV